MSAPVTNWLDMTGQFLYSQPKNDVNYLQYDTGSFASVNQLLFYTSEQNLVAARAKMPHSTGSVGFEMRPLKLFLINAGYQTVNFSAMGVILGAWH